MNKARLEAFSDGVLAIVLTIMVLELKVPHGTDLSALAPLAGKFISYVLSFVYVGIYWNNHHHLMHSVKGVSGVILWANLHLLFWLSLIPFVTAWVGENEFAAIPMALYGGVLICAALAYFVLTRVLVYHHGHSSAFAQALGTDWKGKISIALYALGILLSFLNPWLGYILYVAVAIIWLVPDRRFESHLERHK